MEEKANAAGAEQGIGGPDDDVGAAPQAGWTQLGIGQSAEWKEQNMKRKTTRIERGLKKTIHCLVRRVEARRGVDPGTTNKELVRRFGKNRERMSANELAMVREYLTNLLADNEAYS